MQPVDISSDLRIGEERLTLFAGPCAIESEELCLREAEAIRDICERLDIGYVFKASYDKANRTSIDSFRGPGMEEGLRVLRKVANEVGVPVITDIHEPVEAEPVGEVVDVLQIPAFLCRQTDLLLAAAATGRPVNVKKGQFVSPPEMEHAVRKLEAGGASGIMLTERGSTFGYNNLVVDMRSLPQMAEFGYPVVFDATHSVQMPGALQGRSGGQRQYVAPLARAAVAVGVDALFMEVHPEPDHALSDGPNMVPLHELEALLAQLVTLHQMGGTS